MLDGEDVHLPPGIVDVVLAVHGDSPVASSRLRHAGAEGARAGRGPTCSGPVGFDDTNSTMHLAAAARAVARRSASPVRGRVRDSRAACASLAQEEIDEPCAGHFHLGDHCGEAGNGMRRWPRPVRAACGLRPLPGAWRCWWRSRRCWNRGCARHSSASSVASQRRTRSCRRARPACSRFRSGFSRAVASRSAPVYRRRITSLPADPHRATSAARCAAAAAPRPAASSADRNRCSRAR